MAPIGAGAMGEVYRARDQRLGRDVALKILPRTEDPQRLERFDREARAAAALAHPNVLVVHDVGSHDGLAFLVAELLVGQSLRQRLEREGKLPVRQAVAVGVQILRGLAAAHARGIVHRDLKPDNLFLTTDGQVKILDFGVARLTDERVLGGGATLSRPLTSTGAAVGTAAYMSPEQARGQAVDARSDLWSFGVVLYELLAGRRPFRGDTHADTITAILTSDPPELGGERDGVPAGVERVVRHCLAKQPEERFQAASDVAFALENALTSSSDAGLPGAAAPLPARRAAGRRAGAVLLVVAVAVAAAAAAWLAAVARAPERRVVRSTLLAPDGTDFDFTEGAPALSPDGRRIALLARRPDGTRQIWLRSLDSSNAQPLAGTEGATFPFWAPDGTGLGFFSDLKLRRLDLGSGVIRALCDVEATARGGTWGPGGTILFAPAETSALYAIHAQGGAPAAATELDQERRETFHRFPQFLPDGRHFVFLADGTPEAEKPARQFAFKLFVGAPGTKERRYLTWSRSDALVSPTGHLLFLREDTLFAQPFDIAQATLGGQSVELASHVEMSVRGNATVTVAGDGTLIYQQGLGLSSQLAWMSRGGHLLEAVGPPVRAGEGVELSRDEQRVAFTLNTPSGRDIWIRDLARGSATRVSGHPGDEVLAIWSPDERRLLYYRGESDGRTSVVASSADGSGREETVYVGPAGTYPFPMAIDSSGSLLAMMVQDDDTLASHTELLRLSDGTVEPFGNPAFQQLLPQLSPDGDWLAYQSDESGRWEVYVHRLTGDGERFQISSTGGKYPRWRSDGRELFYLSPELHLFAVELTLEPHFHAGPPRRLFELKIRPTFGHQYAVAAGGERFLVWRTVRDQGEPPLTMVQNWAAELGTR